MANATQRTKLAAIPNDNTSNISGHVLVVEDEQDLQDLVVYNLHRKGYKTSSAERGEDALRLLRDGKTPRPDVILLDLMLPGMDGMEVCRAIKSDPQLNTIPVIMVTAKGEEADVVAGLECGADDFVTKPFSTRVLLARISSMVRRHGAGPTGEAAAQASQEQERSLTLRDIQINPDRHEVLVAGSPVELTATEFRLLCLLANKPGRVFTRQQIIESVHGWNVAVTDRSVDVHIVSLRRKLGPSGDGIQTIRGVGYRFRE